MVPEVLHFHLVWDEPPPADDVCSSVRARASGAAIYPESPPARRHATLPMFPNAASMAPAYFDGVMGWLVETGQVAADTAVDPAMYWTNDVALP